MNLQLLFTEGKIKWFIGMLLIVHFILCVFPLIQLGTEHLRVIQTFNTDEADYLWMTMVALKNGESSIAYKFYPNLYYNINLWLFSEIQPIFNLKNIDLTYFFRFTSYLALVISSIGIYKICRWITNSMNSLIVSIIFLLGSNLLLNYGTMVHPDTLQMLFMIFSLYFAIKVFNRWEFTDLFVAFLFAGGAYATKFAGMLLLPILGFLIFWIHKKWIDIRFSFLALFLGSLILFHFQPENYEGYLSTSEIGIQFFKYLNIIWKIGIAALMLLTVLVIPNSKLSKKNWSNSIKTIVTLFFIGIGSFLLPMFLFSHNEFMNYKLLDGFVNVSSTVAEGHWFKDEIGPIQWAQFLLSNYTLFILITLISFMGIGFLITQKEFRNKNYWIVASWLVIYLIVLIVKIKGRFYHYLIPILPIVPIFLIPVIEKFTYLLETKYTRFAFLKWATPILLVVILFFYQWNYSTNRLKSFETDPGYLAGKWIENNINDDVKILHDKYVYIPAKANIKSKTSWGLNKNLETELKPNYIVLNKKVYNRYLNSQGKHYLKGDENFNNSFEYYSKVLSDTKNYSLKQDFGEVKIFQRIE